MKQHLLRIGTLLVIMSSCGLSQVIEPGGTDADRTMAITNPDEYAWKLFLFLSRQAALGRAGLPDTGKASIVAYDDDRNVVWETWALSSGLDLDTSVRPARILNNFSEVFKDPATMPARWDDLPRSTAQPKILSQPFKSALVLTSGLNPSVMNRPEFRIMIAPIGSDPAQDESRMNRSTYETVRTQSLYSVEGIEAAAAKAKADHKKALVTFEQASKEVKARWIHLASCDSNPTCGDKRRYHWRTVQRNGRAEIWGLSSLHVITKDLPNWFWADFGHIDCEAGSGPCSEFRATIPLRDSTTVTTGGVRPETRGSKWEFYRLRGTQIDFVSPNGIETILSNPVIEDTFQRSSCMTCHSYASSAADAAAPPQGTSLPLIAGKTGVRNIGGGHSDDIGASNCKRFYTPGGGTSQQCSDIFSSTDPVYFQTDFLWSIAMRAFSSSP